MLTPERLLAIRERCERATEGPWWTEHRPEGCTLVKTNRRPLPGLSIKNVAAFEDAYDADFAAHAREDVPALVEEVDRLRLALEELIAAVECCPDEPDVIECHLSEAKAALGFMSGDDDG